jgi:hypothetical protein
MQSINYSSNFNGKLFSDCWGDVRLHNEDKFVAANSIQVLYKGKEIGLAQIVAVRSFEFRQIRDVLSFLDCGKPSYYLASVLQKFYGPLQPTDLLDHVVLKYTHRNIELQQALLREWWNEKISQQPKQAQYELFSNS